MEGPREADLLANEKMQRFIDQVSPLANPAAIEERKRIVEELQTAVMAWVVGVGLSQGMSQEMATQAGAKVLTFGSYRLGLVSPDSDIDALVVTPRHVSREAFFQQLAPKLQQLPGASEVSAVPDAIAPLIKMKIRDVEIDLLFARLNLNTIDTKSLHNLDDDNLLKNLDEKSVRCLNGTRVADALLRLVPDKHVYRLALRVIKHFAKSRGLYSNVTGFFGGITWSILTARVCQMFPKFCAYQIVLRFFLVFSRWNWKNPVHLCPIELRTEVGLMSLKVWNPRQYAADRSHLMPIITPAFPCMNSTYNVTETTKKILISEFARGARLLKDLTDDVWSKVCEKPTFYGDYPVYLQLTVTGNDPETAQRFRGFVESRIRLFIKSLEHTEGVSSIRPWPIEANNSWYIGLSFPANQSVTCDLRPAVAAFHEKAFEFFSSEADKDKVGFAELRVAYMRHRNLPSEVSGKRPLLNAQVAGIFSGANQTDFAALAEDEVEDEAPAKRQKLDLAVELPLGEQ